MRIALGLLVSFLLGASSVHASPVVTVGAQVTDVANTATFTGIGGGLASYIEDGIRVAVVGAQAPVHCCFADMHYASGGNLGYLEISRTDGSDFQALSLGLATGFSPGPHSVVWQIYLDGALTGSGLFEVELQRGVVTNYALFSDAGLFDTLRIGAGRFDYSALGQFQAIAIDDVRIGSASASVPAPATLLLAGAALIALGASRRGKPAA